MSKSTPSNPLNVALVTPMLLLVGCAHFNSETADTVPECYTPPKVASKFDKLLAFAHDTSNMPSAARTVLCHNLIKHQQESSDNDTLLQLAVGRTLSDACGDIGKLLDQVNAIPPSELEDEPLRQFVSLQQEVLKNMLGVSKKLNNLEKKKKKKPSSSDNRDAEPVNDETRLLREKLDAIRSMEKQLDGTSDAK